MLHMLQLGSFKINKKHYSPFLDSEFLADLTPGAALPAASLLFLEIPHLPALRLPPRTPPAGIPPLLKSGPPVLMQYSHPTLAFKPFILFPPTLYLLPLYPYHRLMLLSVSLYLLIPLPLLNSLRVLQWNAGGLLARSTELLHFISSHPVDLICIQESNLNSSSSFRIPGFSALRSDGTHSPSGIFSTDVTHASGGVIIFVRQGLSFSELSTSSLSSLDPCSDYVEVNISLNDSSSLLFLNVYAPPIRSSPKDSKTNFFSLSILPSYEEAVEFSRFRFHKKRTASSFQLSLPHP